MTPTVLVTGAVVRIGRAIATDLGRHGWRVALHCGRSRDGAEEALTDIEAAGGSGAVVQADLSDIAEVESLVERAADAIGPLKALVNNAAIFEPDEALTLDSDFWDRQQAINLKAPVFLARDFARRLPDGATGAVVNVIDQRVRKLTPQFMSYTLAKSALWTATQTLAQGLAPRIRVNAIGPGPTLINARQDAEDFSQQTDTIPLQRGPTLAEIGEAVRFLLSNGAVTGQLICVDGGQHLAWQTSDVVGIKE